MKRGSDDADDQPSARGEGPSRVPSLGLRLRGFSSPASNSDPTSCRLAFERTTMRSFPAVALPARAVQLLAVSASPERQVANLIPPLHRVVSSSSAQSRQLGLRIARDG